MKTKEQIINSIRNRILAEKRKHEKTQSHPNEWAKIAATKIHSEYTSQQQESGDWESGMNTFGEVIAKLCEADPTADKAELFGEWHKLMGAIQAKLNQNQEPVSVGELLDMAEEKYDYNSPEWHAFMKGAKATKLSTPPKIIDEGEIIELMFNIENDMVKADEDVSVIEVTTATAKAITKLINGGNE